VNDVGGDETDLEAAPDIGMRLGEKKQASMETSWEQTILSAGRTSSFSNIPSFLPSFLIPALMSCKLPRVLFLRTLRKLKGGDKKHKDGN
jgi:hypothetical protein